MTLFDYFCAGLTPLISISEEFIKSQTAVAEKKLKNGDESGNDILTQLDDLESKNAYLLKTSIIVKLREDSNEFALECLRHIRQLIKAELIDNELAAKAILLVGLASNLDDADWEENWGSADIVLSGIDVDLDVFPPPRLSTPNAPRLRSFFFDSKSDIANSVGFIDLRGVEEVSLLGEIVEKPSWEEAVLAFCDDGTAKNCQREVIAFLLETPESVLGKCFVVSADSNRQRCTAYLRYQLVLAGHLLVQPVRHNSASDLNEISDSLTPHADLVQYAEPYIMLAEVNSRDNLIDVFLGTYHVLENYMIRLVVAKIFRRNGQELAKIRDFKRIGSAVDNAESKFLKELFSACWDAQIGSKKFGDFIEESGNAFHRKHLFRNTQAQEEFDAWCGRFDTKIESRMIENSIELRVLPTLIYAVRNSIVHNKETELHISNRELANPMCRSMLEELCLPIMQRLAYGLPSVSGTQPGDNPIKYPTDSIKLYPA